MKPVRKEERLSKLQELEEGRRGLSDGLSARGAGEVEVAIGRAI